MSLVCVDTQILIWAIKQEAEYGQEEMIPRSKALFDRLDKSDKKLLIPSIVLGEFLIRMPSETHLTAVNLIDRSFMVAQYDIRAATLYAKIWRSKQSEDQLNELRDSGKTRQGLNADRMIVATAIAYGAECIYSHDKGVQVFGDGFIDVRCVPESEAQGSLF